MRHHEGKAKGKKKFFNPKIHVFPSFHEGKNPYLPEHNETNTHKTKTLCFAALILML